MLMYRRWSFAEDLNIADRADLLIRGADAQWRPAFGARTVFAKHAGAEDAAFGADWDPMETNTTEELWRARPAMEAPATPEAAPDQIVAAWEVSRVDVGVIELAKRLVVARPSAIRGAILAFAAGSILDWTDQVTAVARAPGHRQRSAFADALLSAMTRPSRILSASLAHAPWGRGPWCSPMRSWTTRTRHGSWPRYEPVDGPRRDPARDAVRPRRRRSTSRSRSCPITTPITFGACSSNDDSHDDVRNA